MLDPSDDAPRIAADDDRGRELVVYSSSEAVRRELAAESRKTSVLGVALLLFGVPLGVLTFLVERQDDVIVAPPVSIDGATSVVDVVASTTALTDLTDSTDSATSMPPGTTPPTSTDPATTETTARPRVTEPPLVLDVPRTAYTTSDPCGFAPVVQGEVKTDAIWCEIFPNNGEDPASVRSFDVVIPADVTTLRGQLVFSDDTRPVELIGDVTVLSDLEEVLSTSLTVASPLSVDLDVAGKHRVTFKMSLTESSQQDVDLAKFVFADATFVQP